ncbi:hypothetical protein [Jiulongibacter sediminis]|uniref:Uncharacterized protein n=1 Tax=Jiulongibacter sediminis TaxID=1605367 RepID=A0A0P7BT99_9BACT|nr:hypothetical protein [Jiulongibacter sediminis]KPM47761.1 hypothetical protein AFM12_10835 [Jiulongibacter sediminis]TBX23944.1 hypothetical protein TK44_10840 [Jiulongibacter sediminis]
MHEIEPYDNWQKYYRAERDMRSPFYGREYGIYYEDDVYGYYIDPRWDAIGSETLYCKILYADYALSACIIELFGEWNDTLHNDSMHFKRNVIDRLLLNGISKYILISENLLQFHGGDTDYYEEWFEEIEEVNEASGPGWIAILNQRRHIEEEMTKYGIDYYINMGGTLQIENWRTAKPKQLIAVVDQLMNRRLGA